MSLPNLLTTTDLANWLGVTIPETDTRATAIIKAVSAQVRSAANLTWVNDTNELADLSEVAKGIATQASARVWSNPTGATSVGTGPFSAAWAASGSLLTAEEREELQGLPGNPSGAIPGLGSVRMVAPRGPTRSSYCDSQQYEEGNW